jgi:hypothetical protein
MAVKARGRPSQNKVEPFEKRALTHTCRLAKENHGTGILACVGFLARNTNTREFVCHGAFLWWQFAGSGLAPGGGSIRPGWWPAAM